MSDQRPDIETSFWYLHILCYGHSSVSYKKHIEVQYQAQINNVSLRYFIFCWSWIMYHVLYCVKRKFFLTTVAQSACSWGNCWVSVNKGVV